MKMMEEVEYQNSDNILSQHSTQNLKFKLEA